MQPRAQGFSPTLFPGDIDAMYLMYGIGAKPSLIAPAFDTLKF